MKSSLQESLRSFIRRGERKTGLWSHELNGARVVFDDAAAFANFNTLAELAEAEQPHP